MLTPCKNEDESYLPKNTPVVGAMGGWNWKITKTETNEKLEGKKTEAKRKSLSVEKLMNIKAGLFECLF